MKSKLIVTLVMAAIILTASITKVDDRNQKVLFETAPAETSVSPHSLDYSCSTCTQRDECTAAQF